MNARELTHDELLMWLNDHAGRAGRTVAASVVIVDDGASIEALYSLGQLRHWSADAPARAWASYESGE
jgi:hypothetical protein